MPQTMGPAARRLKVPPILFDSPIDTPAGSNVGNAYANGEFEYLDQTGSPTLAALGNGDYGAPCQYFRCLFNIKAFVPGTTTVSFIYIEVARNAGMTTNNRKLELTMLPGPGATAGNPTLPGSGANYWSYDLRGTCPDGACQFARPGVTLGTGGSPAITFDAFIDGAFLAAANGDLL